jgi:HEAT repeat protein
VTARRRRDVVIAGHAGDVATATSALADAEPATRAAALGALARAGALTAGVLATALADPAPTVRRRAAEEAARLRDPALATALITTLEDGDDLVIEAAVFALGELDPPAPEAVGPVAALATSHPEVVVRETAVAALGSMGDEAGLDAVLAATNDVATVRRRAVLALAAFEGDEVEEALTRLTTDRDRQTRQAAEDLTRSP